MKKYIKSFDHWNVVKQQVQNRVWSSFVREGDIWFCSVGVNIGYEEDGKNEFFERPVLIVRQLATGYFWGVPLTSNERCGKYFCTLHVRGKSNTALLMQLRIFDCRRLQRKIDSISLAQVARVKQSISDILWNK